MKWGTEIAIHRSGWTAPLSGVVLHSIVGNHNEMKPDAESSDQIVPYWSSHPDNAISEKLVKANPISITENGDAIQEIRRILYLHAGMEKVSE